MTFAEVLLRNYWVLTECSVVLCDRW